MKFHRRLLRPDWFLLFNLTCDLLVWKVFLYFQTLLQLATDSRCYQLRWAKSSTTTTCPQITSTVSKLGGWMYWSPRPIKVNFCCLLLILEVILRTRQDNLPAGLAIGSDSVYWVYSKKKSCQRVTLGWSYVAELSYDTTRKRNPKKLLQCRRYVSTKFSKLQMWCE